MGEIRIPTLTIPIPARSNVRAKAMEILLERRLTVLHVKWGKIYAEVRGDTDIYHCGYDRGTWWCHCPEQKGKCAHLAALQHVCTPPRPTE